MHSRFARLITLLFAAIQLAAPAAASVAEGILSSRVVDASAHIEDRAQADCAPVHVADCAICRYLVDSVGELPSPARAVDIVVEQPAPVTSTPLGAAADRQGFDARGPPAIAG